MYDSQRRHVIEQSYRRYSRQVSWCNDRQSWVLSTSFGDAYINPETGQYQAWRLPSMQMTPLSSSIRDQFDHVLASL